MGDNRKQFSTIKDALKEEEVLTKWPKARVIEVKEPESENEDSRGKVFMIHCGGQKYLREDGSVT